MRNTREFLVLSEALLERRARYAKLVVKSEVSQPHLLGRLAELADICDLLGLPDLK